MKKLAVILVIGAALLAAAPAQAYHWYYYHPVWGWGWWPHYAGPLYPPVVVTPAPVVVQQQPQQYVQRQEPSPQQPTVWYWCNDPQGFYPYVQTCKNNAWLQVLPQTTPPSVNPR